MCSHLLFQGSCRIANIKFTGLTLSLGTYILVYDVTLLWVLDWIVFDKNFAELPIFVVNEYFDR